MTHAPRPASGMVPVRGTHLHYEQAGAGAALVLIHAGITDSRMWDDQWPLFAARYRAIRYDMRGFGRSGHRAAGGDQGAHIGAGRCI